MKVLEVVRDGYATADVISRIRALFRRTAPEKVDLDINKLILQVCTLMDNEIHGNLILLETQLTQDVPMIRADAVQIQQVMVNLVRNAIEAMSATMEPLKSLAIRSRRDGDSVVVDVQDEGIGLTNLETIFEPFNTTKETGMGMGMGLAICRSIVEAHAGRIWAVRNEVRGVTFSFSLPVETSDATRNVIAGDAFRGRSGPTVAQAIENQGQVTVRQAHDGGDPRAAGG